MVGSEEQFDKLKLIQEKISHVKEDLHDYLEKKKKIESDLFEVENRIIEVVKENQKNGTFNPYEVEYLRSRLLSLNQEKQFIENNIKKYFEKKNEE